VGREVELRRVLLVDDDALFLESLALLLESDPAIVVAGQALNGLEAVELVGTLRPDVVTMDIDMPVMDGVEATRAIAERYPETCVLTVTASTSNERIGEAEAAGASGHVSKSRVLDDLLHAIHVACPAGATARAA
jgi:DNA-binding NarL/FixJ family response regulator